jgi:hypothetical protein
MQNVAVQQEYKQNEFQEGKEEGEKKHRVTS